MDRKPQERFERGLEQLRRDSEYAIQLLYAWLAFHACAGKNQSIRRAVNQTPLFWNTTLGALQATLFITIGRIFDRDSRSHGLDRLLREAESNQDMFSRDALARRKSAQNPDAVREYIGRAYVPTEADFRMLRRYVAAMRRVYERAYKTLRDKIFAHAEIVSREGSDALFAQTRIGEIQRLVLSLRQLYDALWQLYVNGRRPRFRRPKYDIEEIRRDALKGELRPLSVEEKIIVETFRLLESQIQVSNL